MNVKKFFSSQIYSCYKNWYNTIINLLPDDLISNQYIRPHIARWFGLKHKGKCYLRKNIYYIYPERITLGNNVYIGPYAYLDAPGKITMGDNVRIGYQVTFITGSHEIGGPEKREGALLPEPIVIGEGCWIGARAIIGSGVTIGKGCIVSSGSVVMRSIPDNHMAVGNPARPVKKLDDHQEG